MRSAFASACLVVALSLAGCSDGGGDGDSEANDDRGDNVDEGGSGGSTGGDATQFDPVGDCGGVSQVSVGDFWEFDISAEGHGVTMDSQNRVDVKSVSAADVYLEGTSSTQSSGTSTTADLEQHICPASLAVKSAKSSGSVSGYPYSSTMTFDPPCNGMKLPATVGQDYSYACHGTMTGPTSMEFDQEMHIRVVGTESVTVPAGTFSTFKMEVTIEQEGNPSSSQTWYYADKACTTVKITGQGEDGSSSYMQELTGYHCAKGA